MASILGMATLYVLAQNFPQATMVSASAVTKVTVEVLSCKPNPNFEGHDDLVLFYDTKADIYCKISISGVVRRNDGRAQSRHGYGRRFIWGDQKTN